MSGYEVLRAMRKGSDSDPDLEAWKKDINPYPRADPENDYQWQMRINAIKGDLGYGEEDENGDWVPDEGSIYPHMKQLKEEGGKENEDEYRECVERGSTYTPYEDEPDLYYAATPTPIKPTTQTTIDAHAAGGDNVWQRGQTARQQAAMARDAQQARDLARPYRMAPKVAYKQAQEEQNMEPTQKSAMSELPSIGEMIKGKREYPRENLAEFQKGLPVQTELSRAAAAWNRGKGSEYTGLKFPEENQKSTDQQNPMTTDQRINTVWEGVHTATGHRGYDVSPASKEESKEAKDSHDEKPSESTRKSALPPIGDMIKGKRENPRDNLFEFKKRDFRTDQTRYDISGSVEAYEDLKNNPIARRERSASTPSDAVLRAPDVVGTGDEDNSGVSAGTWESRNVGKPATPPDYRQMAMGAERNANRMNELTHGDRLAPYIVPGSPQYDSLIEQGYTDEDIEKFKDMLDSRAFWGIDSKRSAEAASATADRLRESAEESVDGMTPLAARRYDPMWVDNS